MMICICIYCEMTTKINTLNRWDIPGLFPKIWKMLFSSVYWRWEETAFPALSFPFSGPTNMGQKPQSQRRSLSLHMPQPHLRKTSHLKPHWCLVQSIDCTAIACDHVYTGRERWDDTYTDDWGQHSALGSSRDPGEHCINCLRSSLHSTSTKVAFLGTVALRESWAVAINILQSVSSLPWFLHQA